MVEIFLIEFLYTLMIDCMMLFYVMNNCFMISLLLVIFLIDYLLMISTNMFIYRRQHVLF